MRNKAQSFILVNRPKIKAGVVVFIVFALSVAVFIIASYYQVFELIVDFTYKHEEFELDEIIPVFIFLMFVLVFVSLRQWRRVRTSEKKLLQSNEELHKALSEIKQLRGIIPICASCKKIRDDSGFWHQVEVYIKKHTEAEFSHGICPECSKKLYPEFHSHNKDKLKSTDKNK